VQGPL